MIKFPLPGVLIFFVLLIITSCSKNDIPVKVKNTLDLAGSNEKAFNKVIGHYSANPADSLKLKAAYFLIQNMPGWYYYEGKQLNQYQDYLKLIRRDQERGDYFLSSFNMLYGPYSKSQLTKKYDLHEVTSEQLIENIEMAFKVWQDQPWGKSVSFHDFCEFILPYRIKDETPGYNRREIYQEFDKLLDSIKNNGGDAVSAGVIINSNLAASPWVFTLRTGFLPHFPAKNLVKYRAGSCREMTDLALFSMRAVGIPVAIDFIPQWPYRDLGHEFNSILNKNGKMIMFLGAEDNPGTPHKPLAKKAKIYRHMYSIDPNSLAVRKTKNEVIPDFLLDPGIRDVTDDYVKCFRINISIAPATKSISNPKHAYIAVFNNKEWIPIDWGTVTDGKVAFSKMEGGVAYIAGYFDGSTLVPGCSPFILTEEGTIQYLNSQPSHSKTTFLFDRIYPITADSYNTWNISGSQIQGANKSDFSDAKTLYTISVKPDPFWNQIKIKSSTAYKYYRLMRVGMLNIGEFEFYTNGKKLAGEAMGTKPGWYQDKTFDKAFDNDIFSSFDASGVGQQDSVWIGIRLDKKEILQTIKLSPPAASEDNNKIMDRHIYNLLGWEGGKWINIETQQAKGRIVKFNNLNRQVLYILKDLSDESTNGRIFTFEGNKINWF